MGVFLVSCVRNDLVSPRNLPYMGQILLGPSTKRLHAWQTLPVQLIETPVNSVSHKQKQDLSSACQVSFCFSRVYTAHLFEIGIFQHPTAKICIAFEGAFLLDFAAEVVAPWKHFSAEESATRSINGAYLRDFYRFFCSVSRRSMNIEWYSTA